MEIRLWKQILAPYDCVVRELTLKFQHLAREYQIAGRYCPIVEVTGRVKSIASILDKARRKGISLENIENEMYDIAGVRIICQFVEDIQYVADVIKARGDMEVIDIRDYVTNSKESGYRSYHMIVACPVETLDGPRKVYAEIQIRTLGMNFWSTIEHSIQYKYKEEIPPHISYKLMKAAQAIVVLDSEMSAVRSEIMDAQMSMHHQEELISDILSTIQSLYLKTNKREVEKIQDEFYRIYELQDIARMERFAQALDLIAEGYQAQTIDEDLK